MQIYPQSSYFSFKEISFKWHNTFAFCAYTEFIYYKNSISRTLWEFLEALQKILLLRNSPFSIEPRSFSSVDRFKESRSLKIRFGKGNIWRPRSKCSMPASLRVKCLSQDTSSASVAVKRIFYRATAGGNQPAAAADSSSGEWVCVGPWIYRWRGPRGSASRVKLPWTRYPRSWCHPLSPCQPRFYRHRIFRFCRTSRPRSSGRTRSRRSDDASPRQMWWHLQHQTVMAVNGDSFLTWPFR